VKAGRRNAQRKLIREYVRVLDAPEGVVAVSRLAAELGVAKRTLLSWLKDNSDLVGEVRTYWFYSRTALGLTPKQQRIARLRRDEIGRGRRKAGKKAKTVNRKIRQNCKNTKL
jgi:hypothetical protein